MAGEDTPGRSRTESHSDQRKQGAGTPKVTRRTELGIEFSQIETLSNDEISLLLAWRAATEETKATVLKLFE